jgi:hypothetical protein
VEPSLDPFVVYVQQYVPPLPLRRVDPDDLPVWLPEERGSRERFELLRDHWWAVKRYAEALGVRGVAVADRRTAEQQGGWPPPILLRHRGQEYAVGATGTTFRHPAMQGWLSRCPRCVRVVVALPDA